MGHNEQPIERRAATHMLHTVLHMKAAIEARVQDQAGLLLADNEALLNLDHAEMPLRMTDLAERLILSKGGTTKVVDRLEAKGLVRRIKDPSDRRALIVEITPEGQEALEVIRPIVDETIREYWSQHLTTDEATLILDVANRVHGQNAEWFD